MDWASMEDMVASLPDEDKSRMSAIVNQLQTSDALRLYNSLVEHCFSDCVDSFWRKSLGKQEEICVRNCVHKFLKLSALTVFLVFEMWKERCNRLFRNEERIPVAIVEKAKAEFASWENIN